MQPAVRNKPTHHHLVMRLNPLCGCCTTDKLPISPESSCNYCGPQPCSSQEGFSSLPDTAAAHAQASSSNDACGANGEEGVGEGSKAAVLHDSSLKQEVLLRVQLQVRRVGTWDALCTAGSLVFGAKTFLCATTCRLTHAVAGCFIRSCRMLWEQNQCSCC